MSKKIETLHLFPILDRKLIELLRSLSADEWNKPTRAKLWSVKDIAAHLLDGNIRTLAVRDQYNGIKAENISSYQDLVQFLNKLNADWVSAMKRMSPHVLVDLLEITGKQFHHYLETLDPFSPAIFSVAWAGEDVSENWFHIAREYTEKWHHQQQIREAVQRPGIMGRELYYLVLETFMRALPHAYRNVDAPHGYVVEIRITGEAEGSWTLIRQSTQWSLIEKASQKEPTHTVVSIDQESAWKLFTKGLSANEAKNALEIQGDRKYGEPIQFMVTVMA